MDEMMKVQYLSMIQINNLQTLESESEHLPKTMIYQLWQAVSVWFDPIFEPLKD